MLEDLSHLPPPSISNTPFYLHLISSLPSLRLSIKDAVTAGTKSWLFDIRESSALVGKLALKHMDSRIKRWRARREKDGNIRLANIGGALELVNNERTECKCGSRILILTSQSMPSTMSRSRSISDHFTSVSTSTRRWTPSQNYRGTIRMTERCASLAVDTLTRRRKPT